MNGKANLRRGELCSPENKGLSLVLDGRTQFAPTMSNENRSFLRSRNTPINLNLSFYVAHEGLHLRGEALGDGKNAHGGGMHTVSRETPRAVKQGQTVYVMHKG